MILPHFIDGAAGDEGVSDESPGDVAVRVTVTLEIPVPRLDAPTSEAAVDFASDLLAAHPLHLGGVRIRVLPVATKAS